VVEKSIKKSYLILITLNCTVILNRNIFRSIFKINTKFIVKEIKSQFVRTTYQNRYCVTAYFPIGLNSVLAINTSEEGIDWGLNGTRRESRNEKRGRGFKVNYCHSLLRMSICTKSFLFLIF
jgi:hypothetical protein